MDRLLKLKVYAVILLLIGMSVTPVFAATGKSEPEYGIGAEEVFFMMLASVLFLLLAAIYLYLKITRTYQNIRTRRDGHTRRFENYINTLNGRQIDHYLKYGESVQKHLPKQISMILLFILFAFPTGLHAQDAESTGSIWTSGGIIITLLLILIPLLLLIFFLVIKVRNTLSRFRQQENEEEAAAFATYMQTAEQDEKTREALLSRKQALDYSLSNQELVGNAAAHDARGLLSQINDPGLPVVSPKKRAQKRPGVDPALSKLILWFIGTSAFWLIFGTSVGEYLGIKFLAPDADHLSWLSFGRLRPVHTNAVFWGWASLGMLGLGHYVVPRVSNVGLYSIRLGWYTLALINATVFFGTLSLMAGINNGGGEYREYIWPIMLLFGIALLLTVVNFIRTIARRKTQEIYIANWYIVSAIIFTIVISIVAYVPSWQDGLGETIIQGYYMHQGVGMWFMLFTLGIVYYFLPQQLNKPIYSYSLGILAFWTQILFYTLIGTHHFVFSSIPWWLQTVAIVGSMGMVIPVAAGTTNFILTFNGAWHKVSSSYTLPFFLVGIVFYFTGSLQGTAEAFRSTNLIWHFTDFTVAHSHMTMYGIICFFLWAGIYAVIPRLTGREAPQITVGAHFWLALIGLLFYIIPLMYGSTLKGLLWKEGKPFIDGVVLMAPYWLWRAIGGSLMWLSHLFFIYNLYKMFAVRSDIDVKESAIAILNRHQAEAEEKL